MEAFSSLMGAFVSICTPSSLLLMAAGVAVGIIFGSIPGLSASMAVALFLPLTFSMSASLGMNTLVHGHLGGERITAKLRGWTNCKENDVVEVSFDRKHFFDKETTNAIR